MQQQTDWNRVEKGLNCQHSTPKQLKMLVNFNAVFPAWCCPGKTAVRALLESFLTVVLNASSDIVLH